MKSYLSKFGVLLLGAMFAVAACQDYDEDIRQVQSELTADITELSSKLDAAIADLEGKADKADLEAALKAIEEAEDAIGRLEAADTDLQNQINTALAEVEGHLKTLYANDELLSNNLKDLAGKVASNEAKIAAVETELAAVKAQVETLIAKVAANEEAIAALQQADKDLQAAIDAEEAAREKAIEDAKTALTDYVNAEIDKVEALIAAETKAREDADTKLREDFAKADADLKAELQDLIDANEQRIDALEDAVEALQMLAEDLRTDLTAAQEEIKAIKDKLATIIEDVNAAIARVQSLVYVPEYSDHKATIDFAILTGDMPFSLPTIIAKTSDLKYLVKAEDAAAVAAAIAANPSCLDFVVETVETRATEAAKPALKVVGVKADGEHIIVSAVAKNFAREFFEAEEAEGIYSAALVLSSEFGIRTAEFTNLIPSTKPAEFKLAMVLPVEDPEVAAETGYRLAEATINYLMPCNDTENTESAVKPIAAFIPAVDGEPVLTAPLMFYTEELLQEEGYDVNVEKKALITLATSTHERIFDPTADLNKCEGIDTQKGDFFNITEAPKWDYHYTVQEGVDFENVGEKSTVAYVYTCGEAQDVLTYEFELANAQVYLTIEKNIPWTFNYVQKYIEGKDTYTFAGIADADNVTIEGTDAILDLASVLKQGGKTTKYYTKDYNGWTVTSKDHNPIREQHSGKDSDVVFALQRGAYTFNNSYKAVITTTTANVDYNTTIIVNLVGYQPSITVPVTVDFKLDGKNPEFVAPVDLATAAYSHLTGEYDFLGYGADNLANWTALFGYYKDAYAAEALAYPVVNANNEYKNFAALKGLAQVRIPLDQLKKDTKTNTVTWSIWPVSGFQINYVITGDVVTPKGNLLYADSYVENATAVAKGQLQGGVYSIIKSHLPYYFNVDQVDGHDYTVKFTVEAPNSTTTNNVSLNNDVVAVLPQDGTYYPLEDNATLDWATYTGLKVNVTATLYANGYPIDFKPLAIVTYDPLTFTVANVEVEREMRKPLQVQLFKEAVLTSAVEEVENLIKFANDDKTLTTTEQAFAYAKSAYGAEVEFVISDPQAKSHVYYYDNTGKKVYLPKTQYSYADGILTINGDDSVAKTYYADFTAIMKSRICVGEHRQDFRIIMKGTK